MNNSEDKLAIPNKYTWNDCKDGQPELGGEYNVVWVLDDNEYPVAASMDYDLQTKRWTDPRGEDKDVTDLVIYWQELPEPPVGIPAKIWKMVPAFKSDWQDIPGDD